MKDERRSQIAFTFESGTELPPYLADKTDVYSLCIELAFYLCLRIGELQVIEKADVGSTELTIGRSMRRQQIMNDDLSFGPIQYTVEERIKGNQTAGFRTIPLTPHAQAIVEKTLALYPEGEYLFMRWGKPLLANTFNKHLRRVCKALDIPYRPTQADSTTEPARMSNAEMVELFNTLTPEGQRRLLRFCQLLVHSPGFCDEYNTSLAAAGSLDGLGVDGVEALMKKWEAKMVLASERVSSPADFR